VASPTVGERLATVEEQTSAIPHIEQRVDEIWAWVNQQKGKESLARYTLPGVALVFSILAFFRGV